MSPSHGLFLSPLVAHGDGLSCNYTSEVDVKLLGSATKYDSSGTAATIAKRPEPRIRTRSSVGIVEELHAANGANSGSQCWGNRIVVWNGCRSSERAVMRHGGHRRGGSTRVGYRTLD